MLYNAFVVLHIVSAGAVVGLILNAIIGTSFRKKVAGTPAELGSIRMAAIMSPILVNIGAIGLLVSGVVMSILQYNSSFFAFNTMPWLAMMQADFVVIMAIVGALIAPNGKKVLAMAETELKIPMSGASDGLRKLVRKQYKLTMLVGLLTLLAIALGESKAMMWVTAQ
ncbi:MAG TPA: hypothetical protein VGM92_00250 [Candidatus Kapabacteria bacterium]|jgi:hypothetical protein